MKKTKKSTDKKVNKLIFEVYQQSINKKLERGKNPINMVNRLTDFLTEIKK
jgi:hypothetical protein